MTTATQTYRFDPTVLREYDIRGLVGDTLTTEDAHAVGRAFGHMVRRRGGSRVAVGYDGRLSSPDFEAAMVGGLGQAGLSVDRVGLGPTPLLYFAIKHLGADAGIMITGSHNPPEYNGIKMAWSNGPVFGEQIQEIGRIAADGSWGPAATGASRHVDLKEAYLGMLTGTLTGGRPLSIAWDAGNGAAGELMRSLTERLPGRHVVLFDEIDGTFPNHHPDPTVEANLVDLRKAVLEEGCDLGIGFDGDGDRLGVIDEKGRILWGDQLIAIYAADVLRAHPGATIIADVKASQGLFEEIARLGGRPLMWKTGHSLLKAKMAEIGAPLAGEMSGHIFFAENHNFDDALYNAVRLIDLLARSDVPLSALRDRLPQAFSTPEVRFQVDEARKFPVVEEVKQRLRNAAGVEVNDIDGVRVLTPDGWWLLRASNTQDVLVARAESGSEEGLVRLKAQIVEQLEQSGIPAPGFTAGGH